MKVRMRKNIVPEITVMNFIFCVMVVWIHLCSPTLLVVEKQSLFYLLLLIPNRLSAVAVLGFVFLSSYKVFSNTMPSSFGRYFRKKLWTLYLPYVFWCCLYYAYFIDKGYYEFSLPFFLTSIFDGSLCAPFYFVLVIMQFYFLLPLWEVVYHKLPVALVMLWSVYGTFYGRQHFAEIYTKLFQVTFPYSGLLFIGFMLYWSLGAYCAIYREQILGFLTKYEKIFYLFTFVLTLIHLWVSYVMWVFDATVPYSTILVQVFTACGILFCFYFFQGVNVPSWVEILSKSSFVVYLCHSLVIFLVDDALFEVEIDSEVTLFLLRFVLIYGISFALGTLFTYRRKRGGKRLAAD